MPNPGRAPAGQAGMAGRPGWHGGPAPMYILYNIWFILYTYVILDIVARFRLFVFEAQSRMDSKETFYVYCAVRSP